MPPQLTTSQRRGGVGGLEAELRARSRTPTRRRRGGPGRSSRRGRRCGTRWGLDRVKRLRDGRSRGGAGEVSYCRDSGSSTNRGQDSLKPTKGSTSRSGRPRSRTRSPARRAARGQADEDRADPEGDGSQPTSEQRAGRRRPRPGDADSSVITRRGCGRGRPADRRDGRYKKGYGTLGSISRRALGPAVSRTGSTGPRWNRQQLIRNPRYMLLDVFRGVACLMVVLHHAGFALPATEGGDRGRSGRSAVGTLWSCGGWIWACRCSSSSAATASRRASTRRGGGGRRPGGSWGVGSGGSTRRTGRRSGGSCW